MKSYSPTNYIDRLIEGHEIIVIPEDQDSDSAIFYLSKDRRNIWTYSRHMGEFKRSLSNYPLEKLRKHLEAMEAEGAKIFVQGIE